MKKVCLKSIIIMVLKLGTILMEKLQVLEVHFMIWE